MSATATFSPTVPGESETRIRIRLWPEWLTLSFYVSLVALAIPFHEPWADEAQAWQLASNARFGDLFTTYLRHEGHPGLWYVLLYVLKHCGVTYSGLHWFTGLIATASAALLIFRSPFPRAVRLALPFTFFLAYQYAIVARSYVLVPLLLFSAAAVWKERNALKPALFLGLLANVCLHSTVISIGMAILYYLELRDGIRKPKHRAAATLLFVVLLALAVFTVFPLPKDLLVSTPMEDTSLSILPIVWLMRGIIYIAFGFSLSPWYLGLIPLGVFSWALRGSTQLRYLVPLALLTAFGGYYFAVWHIGLAPLTYIALAWIAWPLKFRTKAAQTAARFTVLAVLAAHIVYTAHAIVLDHYLPYSGDLAAARYLSPMVKARTPMAVTYVDQMKLGAYFSVGLRPYLPGPIFLNEREPFWLWTTTAHPRAAFEAALKQHPPVVVVEYYDPRSLQFTLQREHYSRSISHLAQQGYVLTHTFCGIRPQGLAEKKDLCHLIFELPSKSNSPAPQPN